MSDSPSHGAGSGVGTIAHADAPYFRSEMTRYAALAKQAGVSLD